MSVDAPAASHPVLQQSIEAFNAQNAHRDLWYEESELGFAIELKMLIPIGRKLSERFLGRCYFCVQGNGVVLYSDSLGAAAVIQPESAAEDMPRLLEKYATDVLERADRSPTFLRATS